MTFVVTQNCCNDAGCVQVCPAGCIHPTPSDPDFATAEMLYINPADCIDCGACVEACPVDAIYDDFELPDHLAVYQSVNADYFSWSGTASVANVRTGTHGGVPGRSDRIRVAVVGAGPSGWFVTDELIRSSRAQFEVTVIDRVPVSHGFVRHGVAPDHQATKKAAGPFDALAEHPRVQLLLNVDVGTDITHEELLAHHHAVVYCTGAATGRALGIPGEHLLGVATSADFVHWYNGHPDHAHRIYGFDTSRAVVIGNGNVAVDIARLMLAEPDELARTDMADHAIGALATSRIKEVVVLGRRGPEHAAFTSPELRALADRDDLDVVVVGPTPELPERDGTATGYGSLQKAMLMREIVDRPAPAHSDKRLVLQFNTTPVELIGADGRVQEVRVADTVTGEPAAIQTRLVITATGFRSEPVPGLGFDTDRGRFAHADGRVIDGTDHVTGVYTAGWAKRGPSGVIGSNKTCAAETARCLIDDMVDGRLPQPTRSFNDFEELLRGRALPLLRGSDWAALRRAEDAAGRTTGRPRVKVVSREVAAKVISQASDLP